MRYMGSKAKYAKHIMPILMDCHDPSMPYVEPFAGGGNMISSCPAPIRWGNDTAKYAVALLSALGNGWVPPSEMDEETYQQIKAKPDLFHPALVGFAMYSCSYAGKAWGGYARGNDAKGNPRNFAAEQARHLLKQAVGLRGVIWSTKSYSDLDIPEGSTIYCDPPYRGTTGYRGAFDHDFFWSWCKNKAKTCRVFVSEYEGDGDVVWQKTVTNSLTKDTGAKTGTERLFRVHP